MKEDLLIQKYTRALFEVAEENQALQDVESGLMRMENTFQSVPRLAEYLTSPQVDWKLKLEMVKNLTQGLSPFVVNFARLVFEKERQMILPGVPAEFRRLLEAKEKRTKAVVTTVHPLDEDIKRRLQAKLKEKFAEDFTLENRVDPEIIGGLKIQIGFTMIDGTIKRKLEELGRLMARG